MPGKKTVVLTAVVALMIASISLWHWLNQPQQSSIRLTQKLNLKELRVAVDTYRHSYGRVPSSLEELRSQVATSGLSNFDEFEYVGGVQGILAFQRAPFRRVREGEPWGGHGQAARYDIPAARLVLFMNGSIRFVEESEFQRQYESWLEGPSDR